MKRGPALMTAATGLAGALALTGCSTSATSAGGGSGGGLTFMTFETPALTATFWDTSIAEAQKEVPDTKIKKIVSPDADRTAYAKQLQASGQFPDILSSINPKDFTAAGLLKPFDQKWLDDNFTDPNGNAIDGKSYIPPTNSQVIPMIFYNKKIFAANGLQPPTTWDEFVDVVTTLKKAGVTPVEMAGGEPWSAAIPLSGIITADVLGADPEWIQKRYKNEVKFTDPGMTAAVGKYRQLVDAGAFDKGALSVSYADANKQFLDGESAMYPMGSWFIGQIPAAAAKDYGTFLLPSATGEAIVPFNTGGTTAVSAKSSNVGDAAKFAQAWSLSKANLKTLIETDGAFPMLKNVPFEEFGAKVTPVYTDGFKLVTEDNTKVSAFGQVNNDDALPPGVVEQFNSLAQKLFTSSDVKGELASFDAGWDKAAK
ncbi:extracellular solute-binding protein [Streptomyces sp. NPDC050804]|uniref:ABC transporter substrate-binding protein n=1 Tax=unclassified Streptomyces TaxID=2593676 RepID=UPI003423D99F|nr:extracellular solute-binding protein [Streptomyces sp. NBC_00872]